MSNTSITNPIHLDPALDAIESEIAEIQQYLDREQIQLTGLASKVKINNHNSYIAVQHSNDNDTPSNKVEFKIGYNRPNKSKSRLSARNAQPKANYSIQPIESLYSTNNQSDKSGKGNKAQIHDIIPSLSHSNQSVDASNVSRSPSKYHTVRDFSSSFNHAAESTYTALHGPNRSTQLDFLADSAQNNAKLLRDKLISSLLQQRRSNRTASPRNFSLPPQSAVNSALQNAREARDSLIEQLLTAREAEKSPKMAQRALVAAPEEKTLSAPAQKSVISLKSAGKVAAEVLTPGKKSKLSKIHMKLARRTFNQSLDLSQSTQLSVHQHAAIHSARNSPQKSTKTQLFDSFEREFKGSHTFQPQINENSAVIDGIVRELDDNYNSTASYTVFHAENSENHKKHGSNDNKSQEISRKFENQEPRDTFSARIDSWERCAAQKEHKLAELRDQTEAEQLKECTFQPKFAAKRNYLQQNQGKSAEIKLSAASAASAAAIKLKAEKSAQKRENSAEEATFQPKITKKAKNLTNYQPIQARLSTINAEKQRKLEETKQKLQKEQEFSFQPKLNSLSLALTAENNREIIENHLEQAKSKKIQLQKQAEQQNFSFKPSVNPVSALILQAKSQIQPENGEFLARQQLSAAEAAKKRAESTELLRKQENCTFRPNIGNSEQILKVSKYRNGAETAQNGGEEGGVVERLYNLDKQRSSAIREQLHQHSYSANYTFKPEINFVSQILAEPTPFSQLSQPNPSSAAANSAENKAENSRKSDLPANYTFKPSMNEYSQQLINSAQLQSNYSKENLGNLVKEIQRDNVEKELLRNLELKEREEKELQSCTFKPEVREFHPQLLSGGEGLASVPGLQRYLELKQLHAHQVEEKAEREKKAFFLHIDARTMKPHDSNITTVFTIPKPFHFETQKKLQNKLKQPQLHAAAQPTQSVPLTAHAEMQKNKDILLQLMQEIEQEQQNLHHTSSKPILAV
jgi:hypothetical protein